MSHETPANGTSRITRSLRVGATLMALAMAASACSLDGGFETAYEADAVSNATTTLVSNDETAEAPTTTTDVDNEEASTTEPDDSASADNGVGDTEEHTEEVATEWVHIPAVGDELPRSLELCDDPATCLHPQLDEAIWTAPVLSLRFTPDLDNDGVVDFETTNYSGTVDELTARIDRLETEHAWWSTEATRYHGHSDASAPPSIGFEVLGEISYTTSPPLGREADDTGEIFFPDYTAITEDVGICDWVDNRGVREVWLYTHHHGNLVPATSKLSSETVGDISNSFRLDDMPRCTNSYTLYNFNFTRGLDMTMLNRAFQVEALLGHHEEELFLEDFVGGSTTPFIPSARCGSSVWAPGASAKYNSWETESVSSDCAAWAPGGGNETSVSCETWFEAAYGSPTCRFDGGVAYFVWWMQNLPGHDNGLTTTDGDVLTNWWEPMARLEQVENNPSWLTY